MTATRLSLYQGALRALGARSITALTENRESRRVLDQIWNDGAVADCLEQGYWKWAIRTQEITYDSSIDPDYGYQYAFAQPSDFVRLYSICSDENFDNPITRYVDEAGYWYSDYDTIYVQYVSDDSNYGTNYSLWAGSFTSYVELYLASEGCVRITQSDTKQDRIDKRLKAALLSARSKDALKNPVKFMHPGSWSSARNRGRWGGFNAVLPST